MGGELGRGALSDLGDPTRAHFERVVLPALREYRAAENDLTAAAKLDAQARALVRGIAERRARTAAIELHHLGDVVFKNPAPQPRPAHKNPREARDWAETYCTRSRGPLPDRDINLLSAIADAYKHWELNDPVREIRAASAVEVASRGYGQGRFGEGKYGSVEQVLVFLQDGTVRPLATVLQNVTDAWRRGFGWPLPPISDFSE